MQQSRRWLQFLGHLGTEIATLFRNLDAFSFKTRESGIPEMEPRQVRRRIFR